MLSEADKVWLAQCLSFGSFSCCKMSYELIRIKKKMQKSTELVSEHRVCQETKMKVLVMLPVWLPALIHILWVVGHRKCNNLLCIFKMQHTQNQKPHRCDPEWPWATCPDLGRTLLQPSHLILRRYTKVLFDMLRTNHFTDFYCENIKDLFYCLTVLEST